MPAEPDSRAATETPPECILVSDHDGTVVWASPGVERVFGQSADALTDGVTIETILGPGPSDPSGVDEVPITFRRTVPAADGGKRELLVTATAVPAADVNSVYYCRTLSDEQFDLNHVLSRVADGIIAVDSDWRYTYVNDHAAELLGYSRESLLGQVLWDVFPTAKETEIEQALTASMETQEPVALEWYGESVETWFEVRAYPSPTEMSVYFQDITDRKERESELRRERDLTENLLRVSPIGIAVHAPDGTFVRLNERAEAILGIDSEKLLGNVLDESMWEAVRPDGSDFPDEEFPLNVVLRTGEQTTGTEMGLKRADGTRILLSVSAAPLLDEDGGVERVVVIFEDVTERKEAEQELRESEQEFRAVFEGTLDALILADDDGNYTAVNEAACDLYGLDESELVGRNVAEFAPPEFDVEAAWNAFLEAGELRGEFPLVRPDSEVRITDFVATANVRPGQHLSALRDITERKENEERLATQRDELKRLNQINELIRDVNQVVVTATDRDTIEEAVCQTLVDSGSYPVAVTSRVTVDEALQIDHRSGLSDDQFAAIQADSADVLEAAIRETAATTASTVVRDIQSDPSHSEPVQELAAADGIQAIANIPIEYDGTVYGVLSVAATDSDAFGEREQRVFVELGQLLGAATNAIQTRKLVHANVFNELELAITAETAPLIALNERIGGEWTLTGVVPVEQHRYLLYVDVGDADTSELEAKSADIDSIELIRAIDSGPSRTIEFRTKGTTPIAAIFDAGGKVRSATYRDGTGRFVVNVTLDTDVRSFLRRIEQRGVDVDLLAKRERERRGNIGWPAADTGDSSLTDRQRTVLEAAFRSGYFAWPRRHTTGEALAESLDISSSTLHQHLRVATQKVLEAYFASSAVVRE